MAEYSFFEEVYTVDDFTDASVTDVNDSEFSTVMRIAPDKGEIVQLGQGQARSQTDAIGRIYFDPQTATPADIDGKVRFVILNSQNNAVEVITQYQIGALRSGQNDRSQRRPLSLKPEQIAEPYKLGVQIQTSAGSATFSSADSTLEADGYRAEAMN